MVCRGRHNHEPVLERKDIVVAESDLNSRSCSYGGWISRRISTPALGPNKNSECKTLSPFLTHYYEAERGPFKNICDLSEEEVDRLISAEKNADTGFNRFALGKDFFKIRRAADDLLIQKYVEKFGVEPDGRPFYAVLGEFDRTLSMYRDGRSLRIYLTEFSREQVTFMYPDHFALVWSKGLFAPPPALFPSPCTYSYEPFHEILFTYDELPEAIRAYSLDSRIARAKQLNMWVSSYIEAHIWDLDIRNKVGSKGLR